MAQPEEKIYQVNLQELIEKYIWNIFRKDTGIPKKFFLRRHKYYFDIRWGYVDFQHETTSTQRPKPATVGEQDKQLYMSEYENKTSSEQTYTFAASRETTASSKVEMQENYTIGSECNLEVNLGEVVKIGGGVNGSMSVTETNGQEFSKTLGWNIDTEIKVPSWNRAKASLNVYEEPAVIDFTVTTTMSLAPPSRSLPVSIRRTDTDEIIKTYWIQNIECLFSEKYTEGDSPKVKLETRRIGDTDTAEIVAILTSRGVCRSITWQNQQVEVQCEKLEGAPPSPMNTSTHDSSGGAPDAE